jgi:hypothetical protein
MRMMVDRARVRLVDDEMRLKREDEIAGFDVVDFPTLSRSARQIRKTSNDVPIIIVGLLKRPMLQCV